MMTWNETEVAMIRAEYMADMAIMNRRDMTERFLSSRVAPKLLLNFSWSFKDIVTAGTCVALVSTSPGMFFL